MKASKQELVRGCDKSIVKYRSYAKILIDGGELPEHVCDLCNAVVKRVGGCGKPIIVTTLL